MFTDQPIARIKDDDLRRKDLAHEIGRDLVQSLKSRTESIVIGINGPWGSGKSSLVNFIIEVVEEISLKEGSEIVVVRFNPWMFTGQVELQTIFFKELFSKLLRKDGILKKAGKTLGSLLDHMAWLADKTPTFRTFASVTQFFLSLFNKDQDLAALKKKLDTLLIKSKTKLYITIDDIERLTPQEVADIFQLVKLNGSFANTVFILAYDEKVVIESLKEQFGENAKKYLEKIIQVDYAVPDISRKDIHRILNTRVKAAFQHDAQLVAAIEKSFNGFSSFDFTGLFTTLRDVIRFVNALKLRLPSISRQLNLPDFFKIEALRIFRPDAYRFIFENKESLTLGHSFGEEVRVLTLRKKQEGTVEQLINATKFDALTKAILNSMFTHQDMLNRLNQDVAFNDKRVADKNYFDRYFSLMLAPEDIPEEYYEFFLTEEPEASRLVEVLEAVAALNRMNVFLNHVQIRMHYAPPDSKAIAEAILRYSTTIHYERTSQLRSWDNINMLFGHCSAFLEGVSSMEERRKLIIAFVSVPSDQMTFANYFLTKNVLDAKSLLDEGNLDPGKRWSDLFDDDQGGNDIFFQVMDASRRAGLERLYSGVLTASELLNDYELKMVLGDLKKLDSTAYPQKLRALVNDSATLFRVLSIDIGDTEISFGGRIGYRFDPTGLFEGIDAGYLLGRFDSMDPDGLDLFQTQTIALVRKCHATGFAAHRYFNFDSLDEINIPEKSRLREELEKR